MEYAKRSINGDAGEYLVAFTITRSLGWACRLYGVDLGVDAETEIIGNGASDGDIIKIQVKSFDRLNASDAAAVYVDDRHIRYWQRFSAPIIVCCVDLTTQKVYWKPINATEAYASGGVSKKVSFDLNVDELTTASIPKLIALVSPPQLKELKGDLATIKTFLEDPINDGFACSDFETIRELEAECAEIDRLIAGVNQIGAVFPWRLGEMDRMFLTWATKRVHRIRSDCSHQANNLVGGV